MLGAPGTGEGHRIDLFASLLSIVIAWLLTRGIRSAARFETAIVALKVAVVLLVIAVGVFHINSDNSSPFLPGRLRRRGHRSGHRVLLGVRVRRHEHRGRGVQGRATHSPKAIIYSLVISMIHRDD